MVCRYSDLLRAGRSGVRTPVGVGDLAPSFSFNRPWRTPSFYLERVLGLFACMKRPGRGVDYPWLSSAEIRNASGYTSVPPLGRPLPDVTVRRGCIGWNGVSLILILYSSLLNVVMWDIFRCPMFSPHATTCSYELSWFPSWLWR